jgi:hypothetical protein
VSELVMRRDLALIGTIAAIAGVFVAAGLTASLGVRSSGPPAPLRSAAGAPGARPVQTPVIAASEVPNQRIQKRVKSHRRPVLAAAPVAPQPVVADTTTPAQGSAHVTPEHTQQTPPPAPAPAPKPAPAPAPAPVKAPAKAPSKPKPTNSGGSRSPGVSFDDSG